MRYIAAGAGTSAEAVRRDACVDLLVNVRAMIVPPWRRLVAAADPAPVKALKLGYWIDMGIRPEDTESRVFDPPAPRPGAQIGRVPLASGGFRHACPGMIVADVLVNRVPVRGEVPLPPSWLDVVEQMWAELHRLLTGSPPVGHLSEPQWTDNSPKLAVALVRNAASRAIRELGSSVAPPPPLLALAPPPPPPSSTTKRATNGLPELDVGPKGHRCVADLLRVFDVPKTTFWRMARRKAEDDKVVMVRGEIYLSLDKVFDIAEAHRQGAEGRP